MPWPSPGADTTSVTTVLKVDPPYIYIYIYVHATKRLRNAGSFSRQVVHEYTPDVFSGCLFLRVPLYVVFKRKLEGKPKPSLEGPNSKGRHPCVTPSLPKSPVCPKTNDFPVTIGKNIRGSNTDHREQLSKKPRHGSMAEPARFRANTWLTSENYPTLGGLLEK